MISVRSVRHGFGPVSRGRDSALFDTLVLPLPRGGSQRVRVAGVRRRERQSDEVVQVANAITRSLHVETTPFLRIRRNVSPSNYFTAGCPIIIKPTPANSYTCTGENSLGLECSPKRGKRR